MLRIKTLALIGIAAFAVFLAVRLPVAVAARLAGLDAYVAYSGIEGSLSQFTLHDVSLKGIRIDRVIVDPSLFGFLDGEVSLESKKLTGTVKYSVGETFIFENLKIQGDTFVAVGPLSAAGVVMLEGGAIEFAQNGRCIAGQVPLRTNIVSALFQQIRLEAPILAGAIRCQQNRLSVDVFGENQLISLRGTGQVTGEGVLPLELALTMKPESGMDDGGIRPVMQAAGFRQQEAVWVGTVRLELY